MSARRRKIERDGTEERERGTREKERERCLQKMLSKPEAALSLLRIKNLTLERTLSASLTDCEWRICDLLCKGNYVTPSSSRNRSRDILTLLVVFSISAFPSSLFPSLSLSLSFFNCFSIYHFLPHHTRNLGRLAFTFSSSSHGKSLLHSNQKVWTAARSALLSSWLKVRYPMV